MDLTKTNLTKMDLTRDVTFLDHTKSPDFAVPHTPPRSASKAKNLKQAPVFQLPLHTPKTPKRKHHSLTTPQQQSQPFLQQLLLPPTPEFTPQKSPRRRRKLIVEELFALQDHIGQLLPNHAMAGSGRKLAAPKALRGALDFDQFSLIHSNLDFEEDLFELELLASPSKKRNVRSLKPPVLETPGRQLITDEKVDQWHGKSFNTQFYSDDESDTEARLETLQNPFLASYVPKKKPASPFGKPKVDYATHMEYINHRTGERKVEELTEEQKQFKPKKIDFSSV